MRHRFISRNIDTQDVVLHYKLWDGLSSAATVFDYSLNDNDGTVTVATPSYPGFRLNGSGWINTNTHFQSTFRASWSISLWFKLDDGQPGGTNVLCGVRPNGNNIVQIGVIANGGLNFQFECRTNHTVLGTSGGTITNGQTPWHHLVAIADSTVAGISGLKLYLDSILHPPFGADTGDTTNVVFTEFDNAADFFVGGLGDGGATPQLTTTGNIDEFVLFSKALNIAEVKSIYETSRWRYGV